MEKKLKIQRVSSAFLRWVIEHRTPYGLFLTKESHKWVASFLCFLLMARSLGDSGELHVVHIQGFPKDNVIALVVGRFAVPGSTGLRLCSGPTWVATLSLPTAWT